MPPGFAPAKVNLYLHVTGRRADGYHLLDSLAVFPDIGDHVGAEPADTLSLTLSGPFAAGLTAEPDNLVLRAARGLADAAGIAPRAAIRLEKHLPIASGIGGGSADAAAALRVLAALWRVPEVDLAPIALTLGADVPVCLARQAARMQGIGEVLRPAPTIPEAGILLVNPGVAVPTPAVFRARAPGFTPDAALPAGWADVAAMAESLAATRNDLQAAALAICPAIAHVLAALDTLPAARLARMSGSGATCFALFDDAAAAGAAAQALARPGWWIRSGRLALAEPPDAP